MDKEDYLPLPAVNGFHERFDNGKSHIYFCLPDYHLFYPVRSHTQKQFRIEIINDLGVNIVRTVVSLISVCQDRSNNFFCHFLDGRKLASYIPHSCPFTVLNIILQYPPLTILFRTFFYQNSFIL